MKRLLNIALTAIMMAMWASCNNSADSPQGNQPQVDCKVAVVLPMQDGLDGHWHQLLEMCSRNLKNAMAESEVSVNVQFEWFDEFDDGLEGIAATLAGRTDLKAVIGGLYSGDAKILADALSKKNIPLFTMATTEQLVRGYSSWGNLWAMTETDITQCEVLLSKAMQHGAQSVALIARDNNLYGQTFVDWFAFQTDELGVKNTGTFVYDVAPGSAESLENAALQAFLSGADYLICANSEIDEMQALLQFYNACRAKYGDDSMPKLLFSDIAYGADVLSTLGDLCEGIEGICFGADPETGFEVSYEEIFGMQSTNGEAQAYDACMLIGYATMVQELYRNEELSFRDAMRKLVDGRDTGFGSWMMEDMTQVVRSLNQGKWPDLHGASGSLDFDRKVYTNVQSTVYYNYMIYQSRYIILDYNSTDGSKRSDATLAGWNWRASHMQKIDSDGIDVSYPDLHERWALLVATSSTWTNYRHQVDVLYLYQMLRRAGYDDSHIVLIIEDDLAGNAKNPEPGVLRSRFGGENVYTNATVDYNTSQITPSDLKDILCGKSSDRLPHVLNADSDDNVFIFWSGHGVPGYLCWGDSIEGFSTADAELMLSTLENEGSFRKLLWMVETCYSGSVANVVENHEHMLCFTAANAQETSKTDIFNMDLGVWMSNRFTSSLQDCVESDPGISMSNLYYRLFQNTVGSHVCVFGQNGFGNLYHEKMAEWIGVK